MILTPPRSEPRTLPQTVLPAVAGADLIVVGGVPGAGKTTAIGAATAGLHGVTVLDPERIHRAVSARIPTWVPYRAYRALIHAAHTLSVLAHLLFGPVPGHRLVVHDPGTRRRRRRLFLRLAELRGWRTALVYVDVARTEARDGQFERGRALRAAAFERHWARWQQVRDRVSGTDSAQVLLVDRSQATTVLRWLCLGLDPRWATTESVHPVRAA